jgi:hypothetical protein
VTASDERLLATLTLKVRVLSLAHAARAWWSTSARARTAAGRHCDRLVAGGWLTRHAATAHVELPLEAPLYVWELDAPPPAFGALSYRLIRRWSGTSEQVIVYTATTKAARVYGGTAGTVKPSSLTHDLHVGALYLRFCRERPEDAAGWVSEDTLAPLREEQVLPDAAVADADGVLRRVIEFGGSYPAERLVRLHEDCVARELPYELW